MNTTRRRLVLGLLGSTAVGSGAVFGSGAFTFLEARRDVYLAVQTDDEGYLQFDTTTSYETVSFTDGVFKFDTNALAPNNTEGVNVDATFAVGDDEGNEVVNPPLTLRNQAADEVTLTATLDDGASSAIQGLDGDGFRVIMDDDVGTSNEVLAVGTGTTDSATFTLGTGGEIRTGFEILTEETSDPQNVFASLTFEVKSDG